MSTPRYRRWIALAVLVALPWMGGSGGCVAVGVVAYKVMGPPATPAKYPLSNEPTLVLVESYKNPTDTFVVSEQLARSVMEDLQEADQKRELVPLERLFRLRDAEPTRFGKMKVSEVAGELGAAQVIYVDVQQSTIEPIAGGEYIRGSMLVRVKVISASGALLWPENSEGYPVGIETPTVQTGKGSNASTLQDSMAQNVGTSIGRLFHKWKAE